MEHWHEVALSNAGEQHDFNTISLSGVDVVVPVERDAGDDPLQDDEVRMRSEDGSYDETLHVNASQVAETAGGVLLYRFTAVPPGFYRVWIRVGGTWTEAFRGLIVSKRAAYYMGEELSAEPPAIEIADTLRDTTGRGDEDDNAARYLEDVDDFDAE